MWEHVCECATCENESECILCEPVCECERVCGETGRKVRGVFGGEKVSRWTKAPGNMGLGVGREWDVSRWGRTAVGFWSYLVNRLEQRKFTESVQASDTHLSTLHAFYVFLLSKYLCVLATWRPCSSCLQKNPQNTNILSHLIIKLFSPYKNPVWKCCPCSCLQSGGW